jgi:hypothetical protein
VAGIAAAFKIWKDRTAELTKTLSQVEIPDAILQSGERINAATEAWEKFRLSLAGVRAEISGIEAAHQRTLGQLARSKDLVKQFMGGQLTPEADRVLARRKAASENVAAANLAIRGRSRISEASKLTGDLQARIASMDPAAVASLTQANEGAVTSAEGEITDRNARLKFLDQAADARWWNLGTNYKFWLRYGWGGNIADARKIEQGALGNAQTRAAAARHRLDLLKSGGAGTRAIQDRIDALTTGAASDFGRAAIGFQDARATDFNSQVAYGASRMERGLPLIASHTGGGLSVQPDVVALLRENLKLAAEIGRFAEQQNQVLKNILTRQTTHPE